MSYNKDAGAQDMQSRRRMYKYMEMSLEGMSPTYLPPTYEKTRCGGGM
jgi:hypothetical protein